MAFDIYQAVTNRIIEQLEKGTIPWQKPWTGVGSGAVSYTTGRPYSFLNQMMLLKGGEYITFNQVKALGGKVKKGAKAQMVVFWKLYKREDKETQEEHTYPVLRWYNVFHLDDVEGIPSKLSNDMPVKHALQIAEVDAIIEDYAVRTDLTIEHSPQDRAFYRPSTDTVSLPLVEQFPETAEYYSTTFHELTHSTGHKSRLNREEIGRGHFGDKAYSREELVAEIGASALMNYVGLETESSFQNSAAYIASWLKVLRDDNKMIVSASSRAEKAVNLILNIMPDKKD